MYYMYIKINEFRDYISLKSKNLLNKWIYYNIIYTISTFYWNRLHNVLVSPLILTSSELMSTLFRRYINSVLKTFAFHFVFFINVPKIHKFY